MNLKKPFFIGIAGSGMSALAQYLAMEGFEVSGSDRSLEAFLQNPKSKIFKNLNIELFPQDGSGLTKQNSCVIRSTAIEADHPEIRKAEEWGLPLYSRSELLAEIVHRKKSIAISGTSGKSSVTAMVFCILEAAGFRPSILTGAGLLKFLQAGLPGNALAGKGDWLVFEADESDGSLVNYSPEIGVLLNIQKDHKEISELVPLFETFCGQVKNTLVSNGDDALLNQIVENGGKPHFTFTTQALKSPRGDAYALKNIRLNNWDSTFTLGDVPFSLSIPGLHNISNATAAIGAALELGIPLGKCSEGLRGYSGIERRTNLIGIKNEVTVVDDFAHNPEKIRACLNTMKNILKNQNKGGRLHAHFQPHGFAPLKLMRTELVEVLCNTLDDTDELYLSEIYYAGGTAEKSLSSKDLVEEIRAQKPFGKFLATKEDLLQDLPQQVKPGDIVVSMGARDPHLADFAHQILHSLPPDHFNA